MNAIAKLVVVKVFDYLVAHPDLLDEIVEALVKTAVAELKKAAA